MRRKWLSLLVSLFLAVMAPLVTSVDNNDEAEAERIGTTGTDDNRWLLNWFYDYMFNREDYEQDFTPKEYTNLTCPTVEGEVTKKDKNQYKRMISDDVYEILANEALFSVPDAEGLEDIWNAAADPRLADNAITTKQELIDFIGNEVKSNFDVFENLFRNFTDSIININNAGNAEYESLKKPFQEGDSTSRLPIKCSNLPVSDQDMTIEIEADSENAFFPLNSHDKLTLAFKKLAGFMNPVELAHSCIFVSRMCQEKNSDCPSPIDENHVNLYENFNAELVRTVRNRGGRLASAIKNVHFTSPVGVTIVNPAQSINNMDYRHHAAGEGSYELQSTKYQKDMRDFASYRAALDKNVEEGLDIVFLVDTASSIIYDNRHIEITNAISETVRNLNIQDRFSIVGSATTTTCAAHQNLPGFSDCAENEARIWNFNHIPENSYEYRKTNKIYTPQYTCLKSKLAYANNAIKDKVSFILQRAFLVNDGRSFWNFHGEKNYAAGFDKIADLFKNSGQASREKLIIMFTDGEPIDTANQIRTLNSLNALQKEFNYKINTQIYNLGNANSFLDRIANQDYDVWNDETAVQTGHVIQAGYGHQDSLSSAVKRFYMYSPFVDTSGALKWSFVNTIKDQVGLENELNFGPTLSLSQAIFDVNDQLIGVLSMDINNDRLFEPLVDMDLGTSRYFVVDSNNQHIILHPKIEALHHFDHRVKKGFTQNIASTPHLLDSLFYVSQIENSADLNALIVDPTTAISLPRNYYCSEITSDYTICSYFDNANNATVEAYVPVAANPADEPDVPFIVLNKEIDESVALAHKIIDDDFQWWKKDARKSKEFSDLGNAAAKQIIGTDVATCNYNDRLMYLNGEETSSSFLSINPNLNHIDDLAGLENFQAADLRNLADFFNSDMSDGSISSSDFAATGLRGNLTDVPTDQINALKQLTNLVGFTKEPMVQYENYTKPIRKEFVLPSGYAVQYPAVQHDINFAPVDLTTIDKDEFYFKISSNIHEGYGPTISLTKQAKIYDKFVGFFVNTWLWIDFQDVLERMIWSSKTFRCMCPYPPNHQYDRRFFMHYYGSRKSTIFNYYNECAVKVMNEDGIILYDEQMRYEYEQSIETKIKKKGSISFNSEMNIIQTYSIYDLVWNSLHHHVFSGDHLMDHFDDLIEKPKYNGTFLKRWTMGEDQINEEKYGHIGYVFTPASYMDMTDYDKQLWSKQYSDRSNSTAYKTEECFDIHHHQIYKKYQHLIPDGHTAIAHTQDSPYYNVTTDWMNEYLPSFWAWMLGANQCTTQRIIDKMQGDYRDQDVTTWWADTIEDNYKWPGPLFHFKKIPNTNLHMFTHTDNQSGLEAATLKPHKSWFVILFQMEMKMVGLDCHNAFQMVRALHLRYYRYHFLGLPKSKYSFSHVWWTEDFSSRFSANPAYDACSHDVPVGLDGTPMKACGNSVYRYSFDINQYQSNEETSENQRPSIWEKQCSAAANHPSINAINNLETTTAKFSSLARQLPIIGNLIGSVLDLQFPINKVHKLIRINQFLYKHTFSSLCNLVFWVWFYYYIIIKLVWRKAFGQDMKMVLKRIMRRKNQLYLDENDSEEEDDEIDDAFYDSFELALHRQDLSATEFFDYDVLD